MLVVEDFFLFFLGYERLVDKEISKIRIFDEVIGFFFLL